MTKIIDEDDDFENDFESDFESDFEGPSMEEFDEDDSDDSSSGGLDFEDDDNLDIIIEIDEEELVLFEKVKLSQNLLTSFHHSKLKKADCKFYFTNKFT